MRLRYFKSRLGFRSLQSKVFVSVLMFLVVPFCLTFYFIDKPLEKNIEEKIGASIQEALHLTQLQVNDLASEMMSAVTLISGNETIIRILDQPSTWSDYDRYRITDQTMFNINNAYLRRMEYYFTIVDMKGNLYTTWPRQSDSYEIMRNSNWYKEASKMDKGFQWLYHEGDFLKVRKTPSLISVIRPINESKSDNQVGFVMISVSSAELSQVMLQGLDGNVMLLDSEGQVLAHAGEQSLGHQSALQRLTEAFQEKKGQRIDEINGLRYIVNFTTVDKTKWHLVQYIPYDSVFDEIFRLREINVWIVLGIFIVFLLITLMLAYRITQPLKLLRKKMAKLDEGQFGSYIHVHGSDEVAGLMDTYNKMIDQIKGLLDKVKLEHRKKEEMRFIALQAQINPHFILNTLNNIKWMAYMRQDREVGDMLSHMAIIMESSIGRGDNVISLTHELEYIRSYIHLQNIKYNDRIQLHIELSEEVKACSLIKFTLQPIVENSIYHGFEQMLDDLHITINVCRKGNDLQITVQDNGSGIQPDKLAQLKLLLSDSTLAESYKRVGIINVHERLRLHYGNIYGLSIESGIHQGTTVCITIPYSEKQEERMDV